MALYVQISSAERNWKVLLGKRPLTVGRSEDNVIMLTDPKASRYHCVIEPSGNGYRIRDLDSRNGTLLNGRPVRTEKFGPGDVVVIGTTRLALAPETVEEEVEELTEADVVAGPDEVRSDSAVSGTTSDIEDPIHVDRPDDALDLPDPEQTLAAMAQALPGTFTEKEITFINARGQFIQAGRTEGEDKHTAVSVLRLLLVVCFRTRASDIHIEPRSDRYQIRVRVDGGMVEVLALSKTLGVKLAAVVKVLSDIDIAQRNVIQEGHFATQVPGASAGESSRRVDYRISFAPTVLGQKLVVRILDPATGLTRLADLRLPTWMRDEMAATIELESGMVLACGPTGSGKTTSLYALIRSLNIVDRNVVTIENPVEVQIDGVTQLPVDESAEKTFSSLLRSVLRQDPDVIMVGEIRDTETARIAMQAAITGHLVLSTVHTRDTIGTIFRLLDLGAEPYMVAQGLHIVLAQRLTRQLCRYCRAAVAPTPQQLAKMGPAAEGVKQIFVPRGCPRCLGTGYSGRRAFYEMLRVTPAMREVILRRPSTQEIEASFGDTPFVPLRQSGYELVAKGVASYDEIERTMG
ncbi:MAG: ATPase, T2SS/T4P/T4SS family [Tepidisphaeraceae bacterium]